MDANDLEKLKLLARADVLDTVIELMKKVKKLEKESTNQSTAVAVLAYALWKNFIKDKEPKKNLDKRLSKYEKIIHASQLEDMDEPETDPKNQDLAGISISLDIETHEIKKVLTDIKIDGSKLTLSFKESEEE